MTMKRLKSFEPYKIYSNWFYGSGPFGCFFRSTNFVSLKHYPDYEPDNVSLEDDPLYFRIQRIIDGFDIGVTLFILDLPGRETIRQAFFIQENKGLKSILTFNNVLHPNGLVGSEDYISNLVLLGEAIQHDMLHGYIFILDQDRYEEHLDTDLKKFFNNQYDLTEEDLPTFEMLNDLGYKKILYIYTGGIKEDIESYLEYIEENNLEVFKEKL